MREPREVRRAAWMFPASLVLINIFVVPIAAVDDEATFQEALDRYFHEMGATRTPAQQKLAITISGLPDEVTTVLLEPRGG